LTTLFLDNNDLFALEIVALSGLEKLETLTLAFNRLGSSTKALPPGKMKTHLLLKVKDPVEGVKVVKCKFSL
jgi:hypothetical protein